MCYQNILRSPEGAGGGTVSYVPGTTKPSAKRAADVSNYNTR